MLGLGLKLLGIGKTVLGWIVAAIAWLFEDWRRVAGLALLIVFVAMALQIRALNSDLAQETDRANTAEAQFDILKEQHFAFVADVELKQAQAEQMDRANAARVAREMEQIRERTAHEYEDRLADTRIALERLRDRLAAGASPGSEGDSHTALLSGDHAARCAAFGYASCDALLAALPDQLAAAEDNTTKLIALQEWARGILSVDLNGTPAPPTE